MGIEIDSDHALRRESSVWPFVVLLAIATQLNGCVSTKHSEQPVLANNTTNQAAQRYVLYNLPLDAEWKLAGNSNPTMYCSNKVMRISLDKTYAKRLVNDSNLVITTSDVIQVETVQLRTNVSSSLAISLLIDGIRFESSPSSTLIAGTNLLTFQLHEPIFKCAKSGWLHNTALPAEFHVSELGLLVYQQETGRQDLQIDSVSVMRDASGLLPGLLASEHPMHPLQMMRLAQLPWEDLNPCATTPTVIESIDKWEFPKPRNGIVRGFLKISEPGSYAFSSSSGNGRDVFYMNNWLVGNYAGKDSALELDTGIYPILFCGQICDGWLSLKWKLPGRDEFTTIPTNALFHSPEQVKAVASHLRLRRVEKDSSAPPKTLFVSTNGTHVSPFSTKATAATNIQAAIHAALSGDTILVDNGLYMLNEPVRIANPLHLKSEHGRLHTLLSGQDRIPCLIADVSNVVVEGFTFTQGSGGGVHIANGVVLRDCEVNRCDRSGLHASGGGITASYGAVVENCTIVSNTVWEGGGGGIALNSSRISRSIVTCNHTGSWRGPGAGIKVSGESIIENCLVTRNDLNHDGNISGSGICILQGSGVIVRNCTITANSPGTASCGVWINQSRNLVFLNTIIFETGSAVCYVNISDGPETANYYNCCLSDPRTNYCNITNSPSFVDAQQNDFRLRPDSPCINVGTNQSWMAEQFDLDGRPRIVGGVVDIGAYEQ